MSVDPATYCQGSDYHHPFGHSVVLSRLAFAFPKCTDGTRYSWADSWYPDEWARIGQAGLVRGSYHFGQGMSGRDQAHFYMSKARLGPHDVRILDWEWKPPIAGYTLMTSDRAAEFCDEVDKIDPHPTAPRLVYCSKSFLSSIGANGHVPKEVTKWDLWQAGYKPDDWPDCVIHQYAVKPDTALYPPGSDIDHDHCHLGDAKALRAWAGLDKPVPPPTPIPKPEGGFLMALTDADQESIKQEVENLATFMRQHARALGIADVPQDLGANWPKGKIDEYARRAAGK